MPVYPNQCGGDNNIHFFRLIREQRHLSFNKSFRHDFRVTVTAARSFFEIKFEEFGTHTFNLIFYLRTGIKGTDNGPEAACRTDSGQTGNTGTDNQHFGRRYFTGSSDLPVKKRPKALAASTIAR